MTLPVKWQPTGTANGLWDMDVGAVLSAEGSSPTLPCICLREGRRGPGLGASAARGVRLAIRGPWNSAQIFPEAPQAAGDSYEVGREGGNLRPSWVTGAPSPDARQTLVLNSPTAVWLCWLSA